MVDGDHSNDEGEHDVALRILVTELLLVILVLLDSPSQHLARADEREEVSAGALSHDRECDPAKSLPEVVSARDLVEAPTVRNTALICAGLAQILKRDVAHEIHELEKAEEAKQHVADGVARPGRRRIQRMQQEITGTPAHENPVMSAVFEQVEERHRVVRESMHKESFKLALDVMTANHDEAELLLNREGLALTINLLLEGGKDNGYSERAEVLDEEDGLPANL